MNTALTFSIPIEFAIEIKKISEKNSLCVSKTVRQLVICGLKNTEMKK